MTRHPTPQVLANHLHRVADDIARNGPRALSFAPTLAARGWPASVNNDGGRSADQTTSTERAALDPGPYDGIDDKLDVQLQHLDYCATELAATITEILGHASDDDPIPAGRGNCNACDRFCKGNGGNDRLRAGLCMLCFQRFRRWRRRRPQANTADYIRATRNNNGEATA